MIHNLEYKNRSLHKRLQELELNNENLKNDISAWFMSRYDKSNTIDKSLYAVVNLSNAVFPLEVLYGH